MRRRVRDEQAGTYIGDILLERDSSLARWPDRKGMPLTVWIQPASRVHDFSTALVARVRAAFEEWDGLHLPVHFSFVDDSSDAEVHVTWIDRFHEPISGRTRWARDDSWAITDANITLAVHHNFFAIVDPSKEDPPCGLQWLDPTGNVIKTVSGCSFLPLEVPLMDRYRLSEGEAFRRMQIQSQRENKRLVEIARALIASFPTP